MLAPRHLECGLDILATESDGEWGDATVFETSLDSALHRVRDVILNSISDFDKNLTGIPIEIADIIPVHPVVPKITHCPPEVVLSGGVSRKVRSVNNLILSTGSGGQRAVLQKA
ncbi:hypothetical protein V6N13_072421 [Hibiscus sabdariffa]